MEQQNDTCVILTSDKGLLSTLGGKLETWGKQVIHNEPGHPLHLGEKIIAATMVDVRRNATDTLLHLAGIRKELPFTEIILINTEGNISASMAGMRAGAGDEVTTPFDMKALKKILLAACQRSRKKQKKTQQNPVAHFFEKTMKAAAFAEAGDFDTALSMMDDQEQSKTNITADNPDKESDKNQLPAASQRLTP